MINFQLITEDLLEFVLEILNSNSYYNILENGNPLRSIEEARSEFLNQATDSYLIILGNKYVGIIDFLKNNPKDNCPWIGLLMIHGDYHSMGYGKKVYVSFEEKLKQQNFDNIRIGILQKNVGAKKYWASLGFKFYKNGQCQGKLVECFEKRLT
ncbi:Acetyltransferase (GNAT) domain-containing protein [Anaerovirgula multivorans]|uniref:Acetyltransferase (GNAT) domain-containing protein n=1 Tax=Anaerovirgula multivorans TaxID=312168 RepID=A0A239A7P9_9FIRM|nr:GNAT family N-acetyltransferase [Anaerovirgula multivorans]SNR91696.1 Acetyltransferase (GNAT) domain-containing protein [Anaerovirgula multivorans]